MLYREKILNLISAAPFGINTDIEITGRPPSMASSEFLTNKEQGDWAEQVVFSAVNEFSSEYCAVKYGRSDSFSAGDPGFADFYLDYQNELNTIGKKPDLLIFKRSDIDTTTIEADNHDLVSRAVAAIEVRSSSFLADKYSQYMSARSLDALHMCSDIRSRILTDYSDLLRTKSPEILKLLEDATDSTFKELDFRARSWSSSPRLSDLSNLLKSLKEQIKVLHKRDYLSITPKLEDLSLVNRWIQRFNVPHFYLQVFFDKAYVISFHEILEISSNPDNEGVIFSVEQDVKNQGKTTIKINVQVGREIIGKIEMPEHRSAMKELDRGRLLFYVTFIGGRGYLDNDIFLNEVVNDE